jgi:hypothetical protein
MTSAQATTSAVMMSVSDVSVNAAAMFMACDSLVIVSLSCDRF